MSDRRGEGRPRLALTSGLPLVFPLACQPPPPQGPPLLTPVTESGRASTPRPITVRDTEAEVRVLEGDTLIGAVAVGGPEDATVERTLPGADHHMHTVAVTIGAFDREHSEQILIVRYETEGTSFREVIRCPLKSVVQRFAGGRRLEILVRGVPDPAPTEPLPPAPDEPQPTDDASSEVGVIPPK